MKQIDIILKRISILFYIFVGVFVCGTVYGFIVGIIESTGKTYLPEQSYTLATILMKLGISLSILTVTIWTLILFILLLISIGKSIARKNIFSLRTVELINKYSKMNIISMILLFLIYNVIDPQTGGDNLLVAYKNASMISELSSVFMLLILGQVLKIGYILKQEQELTI